jgi:ribosomal-protein-alanine N-acetyltransferase
MDSILETGRLILRSPESHDVPHFVPLIGNFLVAKNLTKVPHPYTKADGNRWIAEVRATRASGDDYPFALIRKDDGAFIGVCAVHPARNFEFGYWLGEPFWGRGYASEAAHRVARFAFEVLGAKKLLAGYMHGNSASARVLAKLGFVHSHDAPYHSMARGEDVLGHRMLLTRERFENVSVAS